MYNGFYVFSLADTQTTIAAVGGKGASLARLAQAGLPVPDGFHITTKAYCHFIEENELQSQIMTALLDANIQQPASLETASLRITELFQKAHIPNAISEDVKRAYAHLQESMSDTISHQVSVAVRSSATAEDLPELSFAGQQDTFLNIQGEQALMAAVKQCWASLWTARAIGYRMRNHIDQTSVHLAVVVQILIPADSAGIMFTANPLNGRRDQLVINAAWGLGEAVVSGLVTPDTLILDKDSRNILERQTAVKQVMTVRVEGATATYPVPESLQRVPVISDAQASELARLGLKIEQLYGLPMDVEWAIQDNQVFILQARPVTTLEKTGALSTTQVSQIASSDLEKSPWVLPNPKEQFLRASICELMPNPLTPLFNTMGLRFITRGICEMSGNLLNLPIDTFGDFMQSVNGYAYQKVSFSRRQWWLILTRMAPAMTRVLREGVAYWRNTAHPRYKQVTAIWRDKNEHELSAVELYDGIQEILSAFGHHIGSLMASTMGPSAGSEGLFTQVYEKMIRRPGDPPAPTFLMGFDNLTIAGEKDLYDLAVWCREKPELFNYLSNKNAEQLALEWNAETTLPSEVLAEDWNELRCRFGDFLNRFGYAIYDMDFSSPLPMDDPTPILETLLLFMQGGGKNPYERQAALASLRNEAVRSTGSRLRGLKRWAFNKSLAWAQNLAPLREDGIMEIGLGYPVLRSMLRALGGRFSAAGWISKPEEIYWLEQSEVEQCVEALTSGKEAPEMHKRIAERKALWQIQKRLTPPPQLPPKSKYLGLDTEKILASRGEQTEAGIIHGTPCSPGRVTGTARVLHGPEDFDQMQPGDILVAGITTPAWTPLFAIAAAVVTDIGGPLSHGSIVAREYGIPAVLGTGVATHEIMSGQTITVDGANGTIHLQTNGSYSQPQ